MRCKKCTQSRHPYTKIPLAFGKLNSVAVAIETAVSFIARPVSESIIWAQTGSSWPGDSCKGIRC